MRRYRYTIFATVNGKAEVFSFSTLKSAKAFLHRHGYKRPPRIIDIQKTFQSAGRVLSSRNGR